MSEPPPSTSVTKIPLEAFAGQCQRHLQPVNGRVSYFAAVPLDQEQKRQYIEEPVAALPQGLLDRLPALRLVLVPFLEKGPPGSNDLVSFERPQGQKQLARAEFDLGEAVFLFLSAQQQQVADFHYWLFNGVAAAGIKRVAPEEFSRFTTLIVDELNRNTRGEVDERSFHLKQQLLRRQRLPGRETKLMRQYAREALQDTLTLYLHGLCCDIDVEPNPRQLGSRYLRRRLELLAEIFPPNPGYLLFPEKPRQEEEETK